MDIGLMMDCDYREGQTQREAFDAALTTAALAETLGFDSIWLAERHFSPPGGAALISSIGSAPLLMATAIATRTSRLRIRTAVLLLPLGHPVRLAEEVATLDHLSQGRLDLGIGRSSLPRAYVGYNIPYAESRERFQECLEVMRFAWTQQRFSYTGTFYTYRDVEVIPKPYQHPHPPLHHAAATPETFAAIGTAGLQLLVALIGTSMSELATVIAHYQTAWQTAGHPGQGEVRLRLPIYVAETLHKAQADPRPSVMPYYERLRQGYLRSTQGFESVERTTRAAQLATLTYEEVLQERVVVGTPRHVAARLRSLQRTLGLSGFIIEPNVVGHLDSDRCVGFDLGYGQLEGREASLFLCDPGGELHAVKSLIVGVGGLRQHVAEDGIGAPGLHLLDQVALVDERVDLELAGDHKSESGQLLATFRARLHGSVVHHRRFDHAMGGDPELMQAIVDGRQGRGGRILPNLVPGMGTTHHQVLALLADHELPTATARWYQLSSASPSPGAECPPRWQHRRDGSRGLAGSTTAIYSARFFPQDTTVPPATCV